MNKFVGTCNAFVNLRLIEFKNRMALSKVDFIIFIFCDLIIQLLNFVFIYGIYNNVEVINGWTLKESLFLLGTYQFSMGVFALLFWPLYDFSYLLISGEFDSYMLRPVPILPQLLSSGIGDIGGVIIGGILIYFNHVGFESNINVAIYIVTILLNVVLLVCIHCIMAAISFWLENGSDIAMRLYFELMNFSKYPITIYSPFIRSLLTWVVPIAFLGYYPVAYLTDKIGIFYLNNLFIITIFGIVINLLLWKMGIKKYRGVNN